MQSGTPASVRNLTTSLATERMSRVALDDSLSMTRRASMTLMAAAAAALIIGVDGDSADASTGELSLQEMADLCLSRGSDPARAATTTYDLAGASRVACRVAGRFLVIVPGVDLGGDLVANDATITGVVGGSRYHPVVWVVYRGNAPTPQEVATLIDESGPGEA